MQVACRRTFLNSKVHELRLQQFTGGKGPKNTRRAGLSFAICGLLCQENNPMSRRNSTPRRQHSNASSDQAAASRNPESHSGDSSEGNVAVAASATTICVAEPGGPSTDTVGSGSLGSRSELDSLLASCGGLQIVPLEPEMLATDSSLINSLRHEFRASIDELKAAQAAAAESQSTVLKALTEIIFQSSAMRNDGGRCLEERLTELEDRLVSRIGQAHVPNNSNGSGDRTSNAGIASSGSKPVGDNVSKSWAQIRSELVLNSGSSETSVEKDSSQFFDSQVSLNNEAADLVEPNPMIEVPRAIDPEILNLQELRAVFYERESFISTLIGRLRHVHQKGNVRLPAEELRNMADRLPEELSAEVIQTLAQLDELSRIGELELSLERARLARQVNQLDNSRRLIEHNARQLGLQLADDGTLLNPQKLTLRSNGSRRWLSKLGFGV